MDRLTFINSDKLSLHWTEVINLLLIAPINQHNADMNFLV